MWDAMVKAAKEKNIHPDSVKQPTDKTIDAYHSALMLMPGKRQVSSKAKPILRTVAAMSARSVMTDVSTAR
jgi:hypothetical protein